MSHRNGTFREWPIRPTKLSCLITQGGGNLLSSFAISPAFTVTYCHSDVTKFYFQFRRQDSRQLYIHQRQSFVIYTESRGCLSRIPFSGFLSRKRDSKKQKKGKKMRTRNRCHGARMSTFLFNPTRSRFHSN